MSRRNYQTEIAGLEALAAIEGLDEKITSDARKAVNKTAERGRAAAARQILREVAFPKSYLAPSKGRLKIGKQASNDSLSASIVGQQRPTSLARFIVGGKPKRGAGVSVQVQPGRTVNMPRAFPIKLSGGAEGQFNLGLAVRLKPGESLRNKKQARRFAKDLYVLYGPSVDQVFATVRDDIAPDLTDFLEAEFLRLKGL